MQPLMLAGMQVQSDRVLSLSLLRRMSGAHLSEGFAELIVVLDNFLYRWNSLSLIVCDVRYACDEGRKRFEITI